MKKTIDELRRANYRYTLDRKKSKQRRITRQIEKAQGYISPKLKKKLEGDWWLED